MKIIVAERIIYDVVEILLLVLIGIIITIKSNVNIINKPDFTGIEALSTKRAYICKSHLCQFQVHERARPLKCQWSVQLRYQTKI